MAMSFRNCLSIFALLAVIALWAGCSDADKNADKSIEQQNSEMELSVDSNNAVHEIHYHPNLLLEAQFDINEVSIKVSKNNSVNNLVYNDDIEKIAQILRKETKSFFEIFDSFYKKEICYELYRVLLNFDVVVNKNGVVEKVEYSHSFYVDVDFEKKIADYVKDISFQGVGFNDVSLSIGFCRSFREKDKFKPFAQELREWAKDSTRKPSGTVNDPTRGEMKLVNGVEHDKAPILWTIHQRTPGLRHIYNKHLRKNRAMACLKNNQDYVNPNFNGTIVFQLNIDADGFVQKVEIQASNTGNKDFDEELKRALSRWTFPKMNSNEIVTFPLKFFEQKSTPHKKTTRPGIRK